MTHAELVQRAVRWLRTSRRMRVVVAEMATSAPETPDAIGWGWGGHSEVVEAKVSRADFIRDRRKAHASRPDCGMGRHRWYMTPPGLLLGDDVPAWCGLLWAHPKRVTVVKEAPTRDPLPEYVVRHELQMLASGIVRYQLGGLFDAETGRFETYDERRARQGIALPPPR